MELVKRIAYLTVFFSAITYKQTESLLPSQNEVLECPQYHNCSEDLCHFNGTSLETINRIYYTAGVLIITCDSLIIGISIPGDSEFWEGRGTTTCYQYTNENGSSFPVLEIIISKPEVFSGSQFLCKDYVNSDFKSSCTLQNETSDQLIFVAGLPSTCIPWTPKSASSAFVPSNIPEMVCYSTRICYPDQRCALKRRLMSVETDVKYTGDVESHAICGSLETYVKCPEGNDAVCSEERKCYAYEQSVINNSYGFNVLEIRVKKPRGIVSSSSDVECISESKACPVFEENAESIGFVSGFPSYCVPKTKHISENGAFLPSFYSTIACNNYFSCEDRYPCLLFRGILQSKDVERFSTGLWFTVSCSDLHTDIYYSSENIRSMCSVVKKCYTYYSRYRSFNVMELDIKKPNGVNSSQVECKASTGDCALFKETSSQMIFISGLQRNCIPRAGDFTEAPSFTTGTDETPTKWSTTPDPSFYATAKTGGLMSSGYVTRLDFGIVVAMAAVFFIRQHL